MSDLKGLFENVHSKAYKAARDEQQARNEKMQEVAETLRPGLERLVREIESETDFLITNDKGIQNLADDFYNGRFKVALNFANNNKFLGSVRFEVSKSSRLYLAGNRNIKWDISVPEDRQRLAMFMIRDVAKQAAANESLPESKISVLKI